jgi:hypothetical protein
MEYIEYYRKHFFDDLKKFRQQIPIEGNKHFQEDIFKIQYFQLTPSYLYLDILENKLPEFAVSLFFSVLFDQVAFNQQILGGNYKSFKNVTNYPKFIGNCTSVSEKFSQCRQNQHPISILRAINDFQDTGNTFLVDRLPFLEAEKIPKRPIIYYSNIFYKASVFFEHETKAFFNKYQIEMDWTNFWILVYQNTNRRELLSLLIKY